MQSFSPEKISKIVKQVFFMEQYEVSIQTTGIQFLKSIKSKRTGLLSGFWKSNWTLL